MACPWASCISPDKKNVTKSRAYTLIELIFEVARTELVQSKSYEQRSSGKRPGRRMGRRILKVFLYERKGSERVEGNERVIR